MDCEKFESAMMDELYGELDELTSAALRRHVAGCARCASLLSGLRATRRLASLPMVEPPHDLEQRILDGAMSVVAPAPSGWRMSRLVSLAGSWAMRPQTAMAALFLVMIGTSVLLLRGKSSRAPASASITVTEEGTPAPVAPAAAPQAEPTAMASVAAAPTSPPSVSAIRFEPKGFAAAPAAPAPPPPAALARPRFAAKAAPSPTSDNGLDAFETGGGGGAAPAADAPSPPASPPAQAAARAASGGPPRRVFASAPPAASAPQPSAFDQALDAFRAGRYDEAFQTFDALSATDASADLWAARSLRQSKGCRGALERYDHVAQRAAGTQPAWEALLEGARCYAAIGNQSQARARLNALLSVDAYRDRARAELDRLNGPPAAASPPDPGR